MEDWMSGPSFLRLPGSEWPQFDDQTQRSQQECTDTVKVIKAIKKSKKRNLTEMIGAPDSFRH